MQQGNYYTEPYKEGPKWIVDKHNHKTKEWVEGWEFSNERVAWEWLEEKTITVTDNNTGKTTIYKFSPNSNY